MRNIIIIIIFIKIIEGQFRRENKFESNKVKLGNKVSFGVMLGNPRVLLRSLKSLHLGP